MKFLIGLVAVLLLPTLLCAQDIPPIYNKLFSQELIGMIAATIGFTKIVRNVLAGIKGTWALVITFVVAVAYGIFEFGIQGGEGIYLGAGVGALAALTFFISKKAGKGVNQVVKK